MSDEFLAATVGDFTQISQIFFVWWCEVKWVIISLSEAVCGWLVHHTGRFAPSVWC